MVSGAPRHDTGTAHGNRLHCGIHALKNGRHAIIVEIEDRARAISRDVALPTVERTNFERLKAMIAESMEINVPPLGESQKPRSWAKRSCVDYYV